MVQPLFSNSEDDPSLPRSVFYPLKATGGPKRPLVPGFPVTLLSRCFIGTVTHMTRLTRCVWSFGWVVEHRPGNP